MVRITSFLVALLLGACAAPGDVGPATGPGPVGQPRGEWRQQAHWIPMQDTDGTPRLIYANVCRPADTSALARVVVINHGTGVTRPTLEPQDCGNEAPAWFLRRGFIVVLPIRRGYGRTGGAFSEDLARTGPGCNGVDPYRQAGETTRDIAAAVEYAATLPGARPDGMVVVGQSTGGFGTVAYDSQPHPRVAALISMAGGRGGRMGGVTGNVCHPERLIEAMGRFGATASTPMLWVYTTNDRYFAPDLGRAMQRAFTAAGGQAEFIEPGVYGTGDGHAMFFGHGGSAMWGPLVERYLTRQLGQARG